jgi:hypothetical protein
MSNNLFEGVSFVFMDHGARPVEVGCYRCGPRCYEACPRRRDMADFVGAGNPRDRRSDGNVVPHARFLHKRHLRRSR